MRRIATVVLLPAALFVSPPNASATEVDELTCAGEYAPTIANFGTNTAHAPDIHCIRTDTNPISIPTSNKGNATITTWHSGTCTQGQGTGQLVVTMTGETYTLNFIEAFVGGVGTLAITSGSSSEGALRAYGAGSAVTAPCCLPPFVGCQFYESYIAFTVTLHDLPL